MNRERLQRIRNFQSEDWYPALIIRPLTILIMLVIADWRPLTPNRVTTLANLSKLAAAWLILDKQHWLAAALLLQVGLIFDHLDGTIARYRRVFTKFGSFYDKASDMVTWTVIMMAVGWKETELTGDNKWTLFAAISVVTLNLRGYTKWLEVAEGERLRWLEAKADPVAAVAKRTAPIVIKPPPVRTAKDWALWFLKKVAVVFVFEEADLWFWLGLALLIDRLDLVLWLFMISQSAGAAIMFVVRSISMTRIDRKIRELESQ
ncbi:MAG TPA: CDP-alcohol phosphatidyltransferase family protein [Kofleriaceae bacterium]|nr:CDP-alcohol phosphatidyltransferase family protein [Kofleriaceae bacterium]